jgi:putative flavoprotein involved in K+ transport
MILIFKEMEPETNNLNTVIIGGGQAGLAVGYFLKRMDIQFIILDENQRIGDSWRKRWDSLKLFTPSRHESLHLSRLWQYDHHRIHKNDIS